MKSIFDNQTRAEVVARIGALTPASRPTWGKMNVGQMVRHCSLCESYYFGNVKVKRSFLGRIFGKLAIRGILKDEGSQIKRNAPTSPNFKVTESVADLESEKRKWQSFIERYGSFNHDTFNHWFFGNMTKNQLGQFVYKHCDHHLRQFGV